MKPITIEKTGDVLDFEDLLKFTKDDDSDEDDVPAAPHPMEALPSARPFERQDSLYRRPSGLVKQVSGLRLAYPTDRVMPVDSHPSSSSPTRSNLFSRLRTAYECPSSSLTTMMTMTASPRSSREAA